MDKDKKPTTEIDKKLALLESTFSLLYGEWSKSKESESSFRGRRNKSTNGDSSATLDRSSSISKERRPKTSCVVTTSDQRPDKRIFGFENESLFLKNFLLKRKEAEEFKSLGIVGKFGVGKTTLCKDVFNDKYVREVYVPRIWVSMYSKETKEDKDQKMAVLKRMLRSLGVEDKKLESIEKEAKDEKKRNEEHGIKDEETDEEKELSQLLVVLNSILFRKKYLIVLDDVWEDNDWSQRLDDDENTQQVKTHLSRGFPKGHGGRVIVTSRDERLAKKIVGEEENIQRLFPRSDAESVWEIYKDAFGEPMKDEAGKPMKDAVEKVVLDKDGKEITKWVVNPRYPMKFKKELMDKSCGVPWAAQMLAKIEPLKMDEDKDK